MSVNASGAPVAHSDKRYRMQVRFWLNIVNDQELQIMEWVNKWKRARMFAVNVRKALMLWITLQEDRDTTLLDEWFPWVRADNRELQERLERLERALLERPTHHAPAPSRPVGFASYQSGFDELQALGESVFTDEPAIDPAEARQNFAEGLVDLFADEEEDLWD